MAETVFQRLRVNSHCDQLNLDKNQGFVVCICDRSSRNPKCQPNAGSFSQELLKGEEMMSLIRWDPFREFNTLPVRLGFFGKNWEAPLSTAWNPLADIFENDNDVVIKAELPGMNAKD